MPNESTLKPIEVIDPSIIEEICRFRVRVWSATGCLAAGVFPNGIWRDALDDVCTHLAIMCDAEILAAARWSLHPSLDETPEAEQYAHLGLRLQGPIALAERIVASPSVPYLGLSWKLVEALDERSRAAGARYAIGQAAPAMARMLELRGRRIVGHAPPDPRIPGIQFCVVLREY